MVFLCISKITFALEDRFLWFLGVCISTFSHKNGYRKFQLLKLSRKFFRREELWSVQYLFSPRNVLMYLQRQTTAVEAVTADTTATTALVAATKTNAADTCTETAKGLH